MSCSCPEHSLLYGVATRISTNRSTPSYDAACQVTGDRRESDLLFGHTSSERVQPLQPAKGCTRERVRKSDAPSPLLLNWFRARGEISAAIVEGFNNKAKLTTRKAYGFRSYRCLEIALYHTLGQLPEPEATHRFC
jgi:hypothetical protein